MLRVWRAHVRAPLPWGRAGATLDIGADAGLAHRHVLLRRFVVRVRDDDHVTLGAVRSVALQRRSMRDVGPVDQQLTHRGELR
ncbi:MAG: hypothetical protein QOE62_4095 [Actinomycetota bacterium]|nr:hypothetical protein [Actinomycetota bacterium]